MRALLLHLLLLLLVVSTPPLPPSSAQQHKPQQKTISSFSSLDIPWLPSQNQILLSQNSTFAAGFHPLPTTSPPLFTFSVWYYNLSEPTTTLVWSANQDFPVNSSSTLFITPSGELRLTGVPSSGDILWPRNPFTNASLTLHDDGSLVYGSWSSFDFPTNTFLPNQDINGTTLTSNNGKYKFSGSSLDYTIGNASYWSIENAFSGLDNAGKITQENGNSYISSDYGDARLRRLTLDEDGNLRMHSFDRNNSRWIVVWKAIQEPCSVYGNCGPNAICKYNDSKSTVCVCPPGFFRNVSGPLDGEFACQRRIPITRPEASKFLALDYVNFSGGSSERKIDNAGNFSTCQKWCSGDPSCVGFGFKYDGSQYCVLLDRMLYGRWSPGTEAAFFLRVDRTETQESSFTGLTSVLETSCPIRIRLPQPPKESSCATRNIILLCTLFAAELVGGAFFLRAFVKKYIKYRDMARTFGLEFLATGGPKRFKYAVLKQATKDFSNIIGRGGFGDVYKGELSSHGVVAVKCLRNDSNPKNITDSDFWAEVSIIGRMHHLNLVRLWGFCAEEGKRMLVYEYIPNGSLDQFLFQRVGSHDSEQELIYQKPVLDWNIRYRIALGVARAIAYLHEECLEWVLHCDIKPENILLGDDFCPKVSDFGLAKLKKKEDMVSKSRLRGTRGYMAPEWIKANPITSKADVYSFGMVLLELVTGIRNTEMQGGSKLASEDWYFPKWAFDKVFNERNIEDILDDRIKRSYDCRAHFKMVDRMVKTAMWCLQDRPESRPSMGKVAKMLEGTVDIMQPEMPKIFFIGVESED